MTVPAACRLAALLSAAAFAPQQALATDVALAGVFPGKALLVVNGGSPRTLGVGAVSAEGVRVVSVDGDGAVVEFDGGRHRLVVGQRSVNVQGAPGGAQGQMVSIQGDARGHFQTQGSVNGASVMFLVDTGATAVSLGRSDALKAGIDFMRGEPGLSQTANGTTRVWRVSLDSVRVGSITLRNVEGVVHSTDLPVALLGMSFLNRMEMRRDGNALQLRQRY